MDLKPDIWSASTRRRTRHKVDKPRKFGSHQLGKHKPNTWASGTPEAITISLVKGSGSAGGWSSALSWHPATTWRWYILLVIDFSVKRLIFPNLAPKDDYFRVFWAPCFRQTPFKIGYMYYRRSLIFIFFDDWGPGQKSCLRDFSISNFKYSFCQQIGEKMTFFALNCP